MNRQNEQVKKTPLLFTTSWDDGHILDFRIAQILERFGLQGTFYVNQFRENNDFLTPGSIQDLSRRFEIGAHTLTHPDLTKLNDQKLKEEVEGSKKYLENLLGKEISMFCYPKGMYSENVKQRVLLAGFLGARTVKKYAVTIPKDPFEMGTTLNVYPWPFRKKNANEFLWGRHLFQPIQKDFGSLLKTLPPPRVFTSWQAYARHCFDYAMSHGNYFHLWGHSWEVEKYGMWNDLEEFFGYASALAGKGASRVTNSEVLRIHKS